MFMKKIYMLLTALVMSVTAVAQQLMPPAFSTEADPAWYWVTFNKGNWAIADKGAGQLVRTATKADAAAQKWMLIGTPESFKMKSQSGNYIGWNGTSFTAVSTGGTDLKLVKSSTDGCWEIARAAGTNTMNMHQGAGDNREIREYTVGDPGNPLKFVSASPAYPLFSDDENEYWYFIRFSYEGRTLLDQGADQKCVTAEVEPAAGQLWKFVGTRENFQLVSKLGNYAYADGSGNAARLKTQTTAPAQGFSLGASGSSDYPIALEMGANAISGNNKYVNQWESMRLGQEIGFWAHANRNNAFEAVLEKNMTYSEYKVNGIASFTPENALTLWYDQPATATSSTYKWMEYSLPIGNGEFGASLFGGIYKDEIQFNEKSLWTGGPNDFGGYGSYKNFGSVIVENLTEDFSFGNTAPAKDYVRFLDIETATGGVNFSDHEGTTNYSRRYIASNPDKVVAVRYKADGEKKLNLRFTFAPGKGINASDVVYENGEASFGGKLTTVTYNTRFRVVPTGDAATVTSTEEGIVVDGADEVLLVLAGATDFDAYSATQVSGTANVPTVVAGRVAAAAEKGWDALYADHVKDFQSYMGRVDFKIDGAASTYPTDVLVDRYNNRSVHVTGKEPEVLFLEQLYFAYGRYLMIGCSRGMDVPSNLQGIWNDRENAPWNSDIHTNINVQMNYWPAEPTNLSELHMPLLNYIINMSNKDRWKWCAQNFGGQEGWTCLTETNIFGGMGSFGSNYLVANAWFCSHLWQHYRYTLDKDFLTRAFPTMWSCAKFWMARMIQDRVVNDGTYVAPDEYSAEQNDHPKEDGTAHAQQLIINLLENVKSSVEILGQEAAGLSDADMARLNEYIEKTDRGLHTEVFKGGDWLSWGADKGIVPGDVLLKEWKYASYDVSGDKGHRHMSHLMALYPLTQISKSSKYFEPAVNSLKLRGDAATGWSMGWKVNLWARALDGNHAHVILNNALKHSTSYGTDQNAGGIYYNLYDSHAPFQIDGNFGMTAAIAELLLQSHTDTLQILPALPDVWQKGHVTGLKAVGDFTVGISWENGTATAVDIVSNQGTPLVVNYPGIGNKKICVDGAEINATVIDENTVSIPAGKGAKVDVNFNETATGIASVAQTPTLKVSTAGRTVTVSGAEVATIKACDLAGRTLFTTSNSTFCVDKACGSVILLQVTEKSGRVSACKVALQ